MGNLQARLIDNCAAVEEKIQIDLPRPPARAFSRPTEMLLNLKELI